MYASIDAEGYGEVVYYLGLDFCIQDLVDTYLNDLSSWIVEQRREVLIVVGHGIRTIPLFLKVVYLILKIVFLPDAATILSLLQLGTMFDFMLATEFLSCTTCSNKMHQCTLPCR